MGSAWSGGVGTLRWVGITGWGILQKAQAPDYGEGGRKEVEEAQQVTNLERSEILSALQLQPFPEVKVLKKLLNPAWAAQYRERARPRKIELGAVLLTMSAQDRKVAVYHEVGHWLRCEHLPRPKKEKGEEMFADAFAQYMMGGLKRGDREMYEYFEVLLRGKRRTIEAFCKKALRFLNQHMVVIVR